MTWMGAVSGDMHGSQLGKQLGMGLDNDVWTFLKAWLC